VGSNPTFAIAKYFSGRITGNKRVQLPHYPFTVAVVAYGLKLQSKKK